MNLDVIDPQCWPIQGREQDQRAEQWPRYPCGAAQGREDVRARDDLRHSAHLLQLRRLGEEGLQFVVSECSFVVCGENGRIFHQFAHGRLRGMIRSRSLPNAKSLKEKSRFL